MFEFIKNTCFDEQGNPSSARAIAFLLVAIVGASFLLGAFGSWFGKKEVATWTLEAMKWATSGTGLVAGFAQVKSWAVKREESKAIIAATSTTPTVTEQAAHQVTTTPVQAVKATDPERTNQKKEEATNGDEKSK
jgi:hypothetical protein